tara:strand:+ start:271 stop:825 length:555 start_codon:yes stop_codon:yes gene_type:complete
MLTEEKILKNAKKFNDTGIKYNVVNDELMTSLGESFIKAPCTSSDKYYNAYDGGLIQHILNVTKHAISVNKSLPESKQVETDSIIRVCLIHQIGKSSMFVEQTSKWHRENRGEMYTWNEDALSMGTAERSVFYALKSGIALTEDEVYAIYNFNSDFAQKPMTKIGEKLAAILKVANQIAVIEQK